LQEEYPSDEARDEINSTKQEISDESSDSESKANGDHKSPLKFEYFEDTTSSNFSESSEVAEITISTRAEDSSEEDVSSNSEQTILE
jgi:hypothetical protein